MLSHAVACCRMLSQLPGSQSCVTLHERKAAGSSKGSALPKRPGLGPGLPGLCGSVAADEAEAGGSGGHLEPWVLVVSKRGSFTKRWWPRKRRPQLLRTLSKCWLGSCQVADLPMTRWASRPRTKPLRSEFAK